jgi:hypothetical protein
MDLDYVISMSAKVWTEDVKMEQNLIKITTDRTQLLQLLLMPVEALSTNMKM